MTEYELGEVLDNTYDGLWQGSQMYFTLVSAYLVVAYLIGAKLNKPQHLIVTGLYFIWTIGIVQSQYSTSVQMVSITNQLLSSSSSFLSTDVGAQTQAGGCVALLYVEHTAPKGRVGSFSTRNGAFSLLFG